MTIAEMIQVLQAAERGEEIEYKRNDGEIWLRLVSIRPEMDWDFINHDYRIKPKPRMVPLEASDVPPGSVFRFMHVDRAAWFSPFQVDIAGGVWFNWINDVHQTDWETLQKEYEISRDGGRTWSRCEKPESV